MVIGSAIPEFYNKEQQAKVQQVEATPVRGAHTENSSNELRLSDLVSGEIPKAGPTTVPLQSPNSNATALKPTSLSRLDSLGRSVDPLIQDNSFARLNGHNRGSLGSLSLNDLDDEKRPGSGVIKIESNQVLISGRSRNRLNSGVPLMSGQTSSLNRIPEEDRVDSREAANLKVLETMLKAQLPQYANGNASTRLIGLELMPGETRKPELRQVGDKSQEQFRGAMDSLKGVQLSEQRMGGNVYGEASGTKGSHNYSEALVNKLNASDTKFPQQVKNRVGGANSLKLAGQQYSDTSDLSQGVDPRLIQQLMMGGSLRPDQIAQLIAAGILIPFSQSVSETRTLNSRLDSLADMHFVDQFGNSLGQTQQSLGRTDPRFFKSSQSAAGQQYRNFDNSISAQDLQDPRQYYQDPATGQYYRVAAGVNTGGISTEELQDPRYYSQDPATGQYYRNPMAVNAAGVPVQDLQDARQYYQDPTTGQYYRIAAGINAAGIPVQELQGQFNPAYYRGAGQDISQYGGRNALEASMNASYRQVQGVTGAMGGVPNQSYINASMINNTQALGVNNTQIVQPTVPFCVNCAHGVAGAPEAGHTHVYNQPQTTNAALNETISRQNQATESLGATTKSILKTPTKSRQDLDAIKDADRSNKKTAKIFPNTNAEMSQDNINNISKDVSMIQPAANPGQIRKTPTGSKNNLDKTLSKEDEVANAKQQDGPAVSSYIADPRYATPKRQQEEALEAYANKKGSTLKGVGFATPQRDVEADIPVTTGSGLKASKEAALASQKIEQKRVLETTIDNTRDVDTTRFYKDVSMISQDGETNKVPTTQASAKKAEVRRGRELMDNVRGIPVAELSSVNEESKVALNATTQSGKMYSKDEAESRLPERSEFRGNNTVNKLGVPSMSEASYAYGDDDLEATINPDLIKGDPDAVKRSGRIRKNSKQPEEREGQEGTKVQGDNQFSKAFGGIYENNGNASEIVVKRYSSIDRSKRAYSQTREGANTLESPAEKLMGKPTLSRTLNHQQDDYEEKHEEANKTMMLNQTSLASRALLRSRMERYKMENSISNSDIFKTEAPKPRMSSVDSKTGFEVKLGGEMLKKKPKKPCKHHEKN